MEVTLLHAPALRRTSMISLQETFIMKAGLYHSSPRVDGFSAAVFMILIMLVTTATGAEVRGLQSGTWSLAASPYLVAGDVTVPAGSSLVIEPGVVVKFSRSFAFRIDGVLSAVGTPGQPIVFTSVNDPEVAPAGAANEQAPGENDWAGIIFGASQSPVQSRLENCVIRYCATPVQAPQANPTLLQIRIERSLAQIINLNQREIAIVNGAARDYSPAGSPVLLASNQTLPATAEMFGAPVSSSATEATEADEAGSGEMTIAGLSLNDLIIYGYFSTRFEKTFAEPALVSGQIVKADAPAEFQYPFFNLLMQHQLTGKFKTFINFNGSGGDVLEVRNFWGEYSASALLNLRLGKIYRKFGLYNEILDAVPTYHGIEPPELFDADHLMISRTTALMVYGSLGTSSGLVNYSVSTDNGEGDPVKGALPLGFDVHYKFGGGDFTVGFSGYTSGGETTPDLAVGEGSPKSGVLPWMARDKFSVFGGYFESKRGTLTLQAEFWRSPHRARRDPAATVQMIAGADPNAAQLARFLKNPAQEATEDNVVPVARYEVATWYVRAGYSRETQIGEVAPYVQWDYYRNPETIAAKAFGGDNEAGVADDGVFNKSTVGIVFRPVPQVAAKLDQSFHFYKLGGAKVNYWEIRLDVSMLFGQVF